MGRFVLWMNSPFFCGFGQDIFRGCSYFLRNIFENEMEMDMLYFKDGEKRH